MRSTEKAEKAPGLTTRTRRNGASVKYWTARRDIVKLGYTPKMVRLHGEPDVIVARCFLLQSEMLQWLAMRGKGPVPQYDGTFSSLIRLYQVHPNSPYRKLRPVTAADYSRVLRRFDEDKGMRRVEKITGSDTRVWYDELTAATSRGTASHTMGIIRSMLSFGASLRLPDCKMLREEMRYVEFPLGSGRKEYLTFEDVMAFRAAAGKLGKKMNRNFRWIELCLLFQFELALRRRDVIGEYVASEERASGIRGAYRGRAKVWQDGVTWSCIDKNGVFTKLMSKTRDTSKEVAVHAIGNYPELARELAKTPANERVGPIIIHDSTGVPPGESECIRTFRMIARAAGIPDNVQMRDARAGANTEAGEAGATEKEMMALLTHTQSKTNQGYDRVKLERSSSAAKKRQAARAK